MTAYKVMFTVMIVLSLVYKSSAIYCFTCSSVGVNGSACLDPFTKDENARALIPAVECEADVTVPGIKFFCRKTVQTIYLPQHKKAEVRVTRGCGWAPQEKRCYRTKTYDYTENTCQCFENLCNSADSLDSSTITALFLALSAILYLYR